MLYSPTKNLDRCVENEIMLVCEIIESTQVVSGSLCTLPISCSDTYKGPYSSLLKYILHLGYAYLMVS